MKKEVKISVKETACIDFKIYNAVGAHVVDPSCTGMPLKATYNVTFTYDGDEKCLDKIKLDPEFLRVDNSKIPNVSFRSEIPTSDSIVTFDRTAKKITFRFDFTFANTSDANSFNSCYLVFHTENEQGNSSKIAKVRLDGACAVIENSTYKTIDKIAVNTNTISVRFWDDGQEDGDIISVYLNGSLVLSNHSLRKVGDTFTWNISNGSNDLVVVANNQGTVGPNTCAVSINNMKTYNLSLDLKTGQAVNILKN